MSNYGEFQNQSNKVFAKASERVVTKVILFGADIFKAIFAFLKQMLFSFLGK